MTIIIIKIVASIVLGVLAGFSIIYIFNKMPAKWLCDYDQKPPRELTDPYIQRVKGFPWRWIYSAGFICLLLRLSFFDVQFAAAGLFACWAMLMIGLADLKYMIIPDQFVIMLALAAFGFVPWHDSIWQPLLGALIGGGVMLMAAVLGGAAFKKEVMGFGDVKLFASLGLVLGVMGTVVVLIGASLLSGIWAAAGMAAGKYKKDDMKPLGPFICGWGIFYILVLWPLFLDGTLAFSL
ncbi:MAG: A24 family peptidase [Bacillota bacterium]|nr:A24 family peptidase [Bacillota bacterium]